MIENVLVCLEGSPSTEATTLTAIALAQERKATLVGIAIVDEPDIRAGSLGGVGGSSFKHARDESLLADARTHANDWLASFERRCQEAKVSVRTLEVVGRPAERIIAEMERHDLCLMGRDSNFRFETENEDRATRERILRHASQPILLVPERPPEAPAELGATVLVAYDGGAAAQRALASFAASGLAESRTIHVATVHDDGEKAWEVASRAVESLRASNIPATAHSIVSALSNAEALVGFGTKIGAGLVVMGAFARSRMAELFSGSATRSLAEHSPIPLYLQH